MSSYSSDPFICNATISARSGRRGRIGHFDECGQPSTLFYRWGFTKFTYYGRCAVHDERHLLATHNTPIASISFEELIIILVHSS